MSEKVAVNNNDFEIEVIPLAVPSNVIATPNNGGATPVLPGKFGINDCKYIEDDNCKIQGDKVIVDKITEKNPGIPVPPSGGAAADFSCAPLTGASIWTNRGSYIINSTAQNSNCSGKPPMLENDITIINCICGGSNNVSPTPQTFTGACTIKISKAGQNIEVRSK